MLKFIADNFFNDQGTYTGGTLPLSRIVSALRDGHYSRENFDLLCNMVVDSKVPISGASQFDKTKQSRQLKLSVEISLPNIDLYCFVRFYVMREKMASYLASREV